MTTNSARALVALMAALAAPLSMSPAAAEAVPPAIDPASIPDRAWYPPGYRDLRIAAAGEIATFPRDPWVVKQGSEYNLATCDDKYPDRVFDDPGDAERARIALDVSRLRAELSGLGYPPEVFEQPLLDYERRRLNETAQPMGAPSEDLIGELAAEMESRRQVLQLRRPIAYRDCPAPPPRFASAGYPVPVPERGGEDVAILISPPNGRLWLINGFAFRLCERKTANPWNHIGCGWNEYTTDDGAHMSGRYIFEVRWPDGTVRRGARILEFDPRDHSQVIRFTRE